MGLSDNLKYVQPRELCNLSFSFGITFKILSIACSVLTPIVLDQLLKDIDNKTANENNAFLCLAYASSIMLSEITNGFSSYLILSGIRASRSKAARKAIEYIYELPYSEFASTDAGRLINITVDNSYSAIGDFIKEGIEIFTIPLKLAGISTVICVLNNPLTGLIFLGVSLGYATTAYFLNKWALSDPAMKYTQAQTNFRERLQEMVLNVETTQFFDASKDEKSKFIEIQKAFEESYLVLEARKDVILKSIQTISVFGILFGVTWYTSNAAKNQNTTFDVGDFAAINAFLIQFIFQLNTFIGNVGKFSEANTRMAHPIKFCNDAKDFLQKIPKPAHELESSLDVDEKLNDHLHGDSLNSGLKIEFKNFNLNFRTKINDKIQIRPIFKNTNFVIKSGEKVAIIGATGSGKSTIARLLTRLFEPISTEKCTIHGKILLGGKQITSYKRSNLHDLIGVVPQKIALFQGTWRENLLYGTKRNIDNDELAKIIKLSLLDEVVPSNYNEKIPIAKLSAGEQQRIGLARLIAKKPPIIILDESTSALDGDTEARFLAQFNQWINSQKSSYNPTVIIITHRLSSVCNVERVLVLNNGNLAESGHPTELATDAKSTYSRLIRLFPCQDPSHKALLQAKKHLVDDSKQDASHFSIFTAIPTYLEEDSSHRSQNSMLTRVKYTYNNKSTGRNRLDAKNMQWIRDATNAVREGWFRNKFESFTKKTGFFNSVINSLGSGLFVFYSYVSANYSIPLGIGMGIKTLFINLLISYQVFLDEEKELPNANLSTKGVYLDNKNHNSDNKGILINTTSSTAFIISAGISITMDLYTNFLATQQQFETLGEKASVGSEDAIKVIAVIFACFAAVRSCQYTGIFALKIWDRIRTSESNINQNSVSVTRQHRL